MAAGIARTHTGPSFKLLAVLALLCIAIIAGAAADAIKVTAKPSPIDSADRIKAFLSTYCFACHGPQKQKKQIRLDTLDYTLADVAAANSWQDVLDVLNLGKMPPEDEKQPVAGRIRSAISSLIRKWHLRNGRRQRVGTKRSTHPQDFRKHQLF